MDLNDSSTESTFFLPVSPTTRRSNGILKRTSSPRGQLTIVLLTRVCDVLSVQSVLPYINHLVGELDIVKGDARKVGYYVGLLGSSLDIAGTITVLFWNWLSDYVGRKPVLLIGTAGSMLSMLCFGLSRSFSALVFSRCLWGLLNGNVGVAKTIIGEIADSGSRPQAFALLSSLWTVGASIGSFIGGSLARPSDRFPELFKGSFWKEYPYFLPCLTVSIVSGSMFFAILLLFKETVSGRLPSPMAQETELEDFSLLPSSRPRRPVQGSVLHLLTRPVVIAIINFSYLEFITSCYLTFTPFFLAMPIEIGGAGFDPVRIGYILCVLRIIDAVILTVYCTTVVRRLGERRAYIVGMAGFLMLWTLFPAINLSARRTGTSLGVWLGVFLIVVPMVLMDLSYSCIYMFVNAASPSKHSLGAVNGLAQTVASFPSLVGGAVAPALFSFSVEQHILGGYALYVIFFILSCFGVWLAFTLPEHARPKWDWDEEWEEE